jgi:hypothetical protein
MFIFPQSLSVKPISTPAHPTFLAPQAPDWWDVAAPDDPNTLRLKRRVLRTPIEGSLSDFRPQG